MTDPNHTQRHRFPICGERTYLPATLAALAGEFVAPGASSVDVNQELRCCLEEHDEIDHDHHAYVMDLDDPESGSLWTSWIRGERPDEVFVRQDCPAMDTSGSRPMPCCEFLNHPGHHSWEIADPRLGGGNGRAAA